MEEKKAGYEVGARLCAHFVGFFPVMRATSLWRGCITIET